MIAIVDNYDSFTYNLAQYLAELGAKVEVFRNDAVSVDDLERMHPSHVVLSPGPGTPSDAGITLETIRRLGGTVPMLGVCLGHQAIGQAFGARVIRAMTVMHGKTSPISHDGRGVFQDVDNPFMATRYHSLVVERHAFPECLEISAQTAEGEIMGLRHRGARIEGVQFHPEALFTEHGHKLLHNFIFPKG
jgi:para-aminobenzoate synthetase component II